MKYNTDGDVSVQKSFVRKEFNFGLQERLTGTDMPVEENDFATELVNSKNSNMKCVNNLNLLLHWYSKMFYLLFNYDKAFVK